jgi:hypothetical protein
MNGSVGALTLCGAEAETDSQSNAVPRIDGDGSA